ncbi:MAG: SRPBCC family protein [Aquabacterium sp.]
MAVTVDIELGYEFSVKARFKDVFDVLSDVPLSASHFPKVERLVDMGNNTYRWEMHKVGTAQLSLQTIYASKYLSNRRQGTVVWTPVKGVGNAQVSGSWKVSNKKTHTDLVLLIKGQVEAPLPELMKVVVAPMVNSEFEALVETYIDNLIQRFGGEV